MPKNIDAGTKLVSSEKKDATRGDGTRNQGAMRGATMPQKISSFIIDLEEFEKYLAVFLYPKRERIAISNL